MEINNIITDDDLIDFLLDRHKETGNQMFFTAANSIALYRRDVNFLHYSLEALDKWVSVEDGLPKAFKDVLCWYEYFRYGDYNCMYQTYGIGHYNDICEAWGGEVSNGYKSRVLAWMPLPAPPTEKEN